MVGTVIAKVSGAAGGATLAVEGGTSSTTYELSKTDGSANDHLKTDGSGNLAWVAPPTAGTNTPAWHVGINSATQTIPDASQTIFWIHLGHSKLQRCSGDSRKVCN